MGFRGSNVTGALASQIKPLPSLLLGFGVPLEELAIKFQASVAPGTEILVENRVIFDAGDLGLDLFQGPVFDQRNEQNGSSFSNTIRPGLVNCQFIVKVNVSQSVSIIPSSGAMPSLGQFGAPRVQMATPGSVRNR